MIPEDTNRVANATDDVNHPSHYQNVQINNQKYEVIDLNHGILNYLGLPSDITGDLYNVIKYLMRFPYKHPDNQKKDLQKAIFYASSMADNAKDHIINENYYQNDYQNYLFLMHNHQAPQRFKPQDIYEKIDLINLDPDLHDQVMPYIHKFYQLLLDSLLNIDEYGYGFKPQQLEFNHLYMTYVNITQLLQSLLNVVINNEY